MALKIWGFLIVLIIAQPASAQQPLMGVAKATDGDSLEVGGVRVRLFGIDAPELTQTCTRGDSKWACGAEAADHLNRLVTGKEVRCSRLGTDQFGRVLGRCSINGFEINRMVVERGYATAFRKYSNDYVTAENRAKEAGVGIWASSFQAPAEVRAQERGQVTVGNSSHSSRRPSSQAALSARSGCRIKGNHSRKGEWIYHLPGMPYYNATRAEAMFCTEAEARAAGYRRARTPQ